MESGRASNSEIVSSPDSDHQQEKSTDDDSTGIGRSYECAFCKRGFTNAQALGGHMNIHRKDKAKAKQKRSPEEYSSIKLDEDYESLRFMSQIPDRGREQKTRYYRPGGVQVNYQVYFPTSYPNSQIGDYSLLRPVWRPELGGVDPNLSLRIGQFEAHDEDGERTVKDNEVDLELRLGHDP